MGRCGAVASGAVTRSVALLVNPTSGGGRGAREGRAAADRLRDLGVAVRLLEGKDPVDAARVARDAVQSGVDALVVAGGDGMVHLGVQCVAGTDIPLGIVPTGTGNDFATALGLPPHDAAGAAQVIAGWQVRTVDAVLTQSGAGQRWFAGVLSSGFDSAVNERANRMRWPKGRSRYNVAILAELRVFKAVPFRLTIDGAVIEAHAMLVAVGNNTSYGGGMRVTPGALLDDGLLHVTVLRPSSAPWSSCGSSPASTRARTSRTGRWTCTSVATVRLEAPGAIAYADGERVGAAAHHGDLRARRSSRRPVVARGGIGSSGMASPAELASFRAGYPFGLDPFQVRPARRWRPVAASWSRPPRVPARRWSASSPCTWRWPRDASASTRPRSRRCPTRSTATSCARYGAERVGLLTGDNSVNGEAPVVVMTTEVLRNMLYASSPALADLGYVVMDEVHYLSDRLRGAVWEEVIIHLPEVVRLVSLSATVSNAEEFGEWLARCAATPRSSSRSTGRCRCGSTSWSAPGSTTCSSTTSRRWSVLSSCGSPATSSVSPGQGDRRPQRGGHRRRSQDTPSRVDVVERLDRAGLLPAIMFVFSRAGCDAAVDAVPALGTAAHDTCRARRGRGLRP